MAGIEPEQDVLENLPEESDSTSNPDLGEQDFLEIAQLLKEQSLVPLKEDLAEWLQHLLGVDINAENFIQVLDNGVCVCQLVNLIQENIETSDSHSSTSTKKVSFRQEVGSGSWFARDNCANFLHWCHRFGVKHECMFESDDLVSHKNERSVILCLLELARMAQKYGIEPPSLVRMEKEIEAEEHGAAVNINSLGGHGDYAQYMQVEIEIIDLATASEAKKASSAASGEGLVRPASASSNSSTNNNVLKESDSIISLKKKVQHLSKRFKCDKYVRHMRDCHFEIFGKLVLLRVLQGRHVMVRVGGGWDTLEHYLIKHLPTKIIEFNRSEFMNSNKYLYVKGQYKPGR